MRTRSAVASKPAKRAKGLEERPHIKKGRIPGQRKVEQDLERILANCFGTKPMVVRPLAKKLASERDMGIVSPEIVAALLQLVEEYWPAVHTTVMAIEVAHAINIVIGWVQKQLESGEARVQGAGAVKQFQELARGHLAGQVSDLKRRHESRYISTPEFDKQQRLLDISREVLERSIR